MSEARNPLELLRTLCDLSTARDQRLELLRSLTESEFADPDDRIVFQSIGLLLPRGEVSKARLTVHLNNRGFPDIDVDKYFMA